MHRTVFDTPGINAVMRGLGFSFLKIFRWQVEGQVPQEKKCVLIAAPHTSNWDLPIMLSTAFVLRAKLFWMGKQTIFRRPFGTFFKWLGGIPVDRSTSNSLVAQSIELLRRSEELILAVAPEGSRSKVRVWKTGFYYIANGAEVPIAMGFIDYGRKVSGIGPVLFPTGDIEADMRVIRAFYTQIVAKYPEKSSLASVDEKPGLPSIEG